MPQSFSGQAENLSLRDREVVSECHDLPRKSFDQNDYNDHSHMQDQPMEMDGFSFDEDDVSSDMLNESFDHDGIIPSETEPSRNEDLLSDDEEFFDDQTSELNTFLTVTAGNEKVTLSKDETEKLVLRGMGWKDLIKKTEELERKERRNHDAVRLVEDFAREVGIEPSAYVRKVKVERLINCGIPSRIAERQVELEDRLRAAEKNPQESDADRRRNGYKRFLSEFPGVSPDDIPNEVWDKVRCGEDMTTAYTMYENARLASQLEALKNETHNRKKSTYSRHYAGESNIKDPFLDGFYA